jgi:hypothetical protein
MLAHGTMKVASAAVILAGSLISAPAPVFAKSGYHAGRHHAAAPRYKRHRGNAGAAAAAGIIGGLALGALAAGAARSEPRYYETYPAYGGYGYGGCYWTKQRVYDGWGYARWQRVRVCN